MTLDTQALRALYPPAHERALAKQLGALDRHCRRFIELSPFVVLASSDGAGRLDASPRGGAPGFVQVVDAHTLLVPDAPGNRRLDTLGNLAVHGRIGLLFMIPGIDETLRVNGAAVVTRDPSRLAPFAASRHPPPVVIEVRVEEAYLHCAKAFMRSRLWSEAARVERSVLPTMGRMIGDQTGHPAPAESEAEMRARYAADL
jgi:hypothetical protein